MYHNIINNYDNYYFINKYFININIMKIYILRHEDRTQDCSFFSPLTSLGLNNAVNLINYLDTCNINIIFSSPFIRTLQTIKPYIDTKKCIINIEYGLSEIHHKDIIAKKSVGLTLPIYLAKYYNYDCNKKKSARFSWVLT